MDDLYLLFAGRQYYPEGGTEDLHLAFRAGSDTEATARALASLPDVEPDWYYLAAFDDIEVLRIVWDPQEFCEVSQAR